ncbi:MAG: nuclear transport factor 2 family protein [Hyphomonadaceae bacterium]
MTDNTAAGMRLSRRLTLLAPALLGLGWSSTASAAQSRGNRRAPPLSLQDRAAIQDLFASYLWAYDCSDEDGFIDLFADDCMVVGLGRHHVGEEALRVWFRYLLNLRDTAGDFWLHEAGQFRFEGDGHTCVVYAYATHFRSHPGSREMGVRSLGYFVNECVKTGGVWKFRRLTINQWDNHAQPWKKPKPWEIPDAGAPVR